MKEVKVKQDNQVMKNQNNTLKDAETLSRVRWINMSNSFHITLSNFKLCVICQKWFNSQKYHQIKVLILEQDILILCCFHRSVLLNLLLQSVVSEPAHDTVR